MDKILWKYVLNTAKEGSQYGKPQIFDYKGTPSFEKLPDFKLDLLKVFDPDEQVTEPSPKKYNRL